MFRQPSDTASGENHQDQHDDDIGVWKVRNSDRESGGNMALRRTERA